MPNHSQKTIKSGYLAQKCGMTDLKFCTQNNETERSNMK